MSSDETKLMKTAKQWAGEWSTCEVNFENFLQVVQLDARDEARRAVLGTLQEHWGHEIIRSVAKELCDRCGWDVPKEPFHAEYLHPPKTTPPEAPAPGTWAEAQLMGKVPEAQRNPALAAPLSSSPPNPQTCSPPPSQEPSPKPSGASYPTAEGQPPAPAWEGTLDAAGVDSSLKAPDPHSAPGGYLPADVRLDLHSEELLLHLQRLEALEKWKADRAEPLLLIDAESLKLAHQRLLELEKKWEEIPLAEPAPCRPPQAPLIELAPGYCLKPEMVSRVLGAELLWTGHRWLVSW